MVDSFASLLMHLAVRAETFKAGHFHGATNILPLKGCGQLHLIQRGLVEVHHEAFAPLRIEEPSLLLYPSSSPYRFVTDSNLGATLLCAHVAFSFGVSDQIALALPACICLPLSAIAAGESILLSMFAEAENNYCGRQAALDRLSELLMIWLLRAMLAQGRINSGAIAGMGHPKLKLALTAMHQRPEYSWSLEQLAHEAGMSRTVFATGFREVVGCTPALYLQRWRIGLAQKQLREGRPLKHVAQDVGYSGAASLSRVFRDQVGVSPREWLKRLAGEAPPRH